MTEKSVSLFQLVPPLARHNTKMTMEGNAHFENIETWLISWWLHLSSLCSRSSPIIWYLIFTHMQVRRRKMKTTGVEEKWFLFNINVLLLLSFCLFPSFTVLRFFFVLFSQISAQHSEWDQHTARLIEDLVSCGQWTGIVFFFSLFVPLVSYLVLGSMILYMQ